ncbi:MAG TPA: DUF1616 domain-containing protein, partial [Methanoculleus sp.]|nr:DUF1616 domain-containing protein [Methanoculleus sp.]
MPPEASPGPLSGPPRTCTVLPGLTGSCPDASLSIAAQGESDDLSGGSAPRFERVLSLVLIAAVLAALGTTIFIIVSPGEGEKFTEFYILGPTGKAA